MGVNALVASAKEKRRTRILHALAIHGPLNAYKTWTKLVKEETATQPTIRADLEELLQKGFVKNVDTNQKARGGRPSKHYDLSLLGLAELLYGLPGSELTAGFIGHVAKKYRDVMPLIFDAWPSIVEAGVEDIARRQLSLHCLEISDMAREWFLENGMTGEPPQKLQHLLARYFLRPLAPRFPERQRWIEALRGCETLRKTTLHALTDRAAREIQRVNVSMKLLSAPELRLVTSSDDRKAMEPIQAAEEEMVRRLARSPRFTELVLKLIKEGGEDAKTAGGASER
jgi:hypothetical protein